MMDFTGNSYQNLLRSMLDRVPDTYDKRDGSFFQIALGAAAYALEEFYIGLSQVQEMAFIQTAVGQALDYLAVIGGVRRKRATPAVRLGEFDAPVPLGARFSTIGDGLNFTVTAAGGQPGEYQLTAETPGSVGNQYSGAVLPITFIEGLSSARLTDILVPGDDAETDEELRQRLIAAMTDRPFGGNIAAYRESILAVDGVGQVQVYPTWNGGGTVKCSILGADLLPASATLVENVQAMIDPPLGSGQGLGMAPIGAKVTITSPQTVTVNMRAGVTLRPGMTLGQVRPLVQAAVEGYLTDIRKNWGKPVAGTSQEYACTVYASRVLAAILSCQGLVNASGVLLNENPADILLEESGQLQQVPVAGEVTLYEV